jgi:cytochrome c oxidase subunit 3
MESNTVLSAQTTGAAVHHDPSAHAPAPSGWPILLALGMSVFSVGVLLQVSEVSYGSLITILGGLMSVICAVGWANSISQDRTHLDREQSTKDLTKGIFLFITAEACTFAAFFGYLYYNRIYAPAWPPPGTPHLETDLPGIGTLLLVGSSFTFNWAMHAYKKAKKGVAKTWILVTLALGISFLAIQGYEWGFLHGYYSFDQATNSFGSLFYVMTGFHGLHVLVGILMISMMYFRLEKGEMSEKYHFSLNAAEYYWHFVDVVWVLLFFSLYLLQ